MFEQFAVAEGGYAVHGGDDVPLLQAGFLGGAVGGHLGDVDAVVAVDAEFLGEAGVKFLNAGTQQAALHHAELTQVFHHLTHDGGGDGKGIAGKDARRAADGRVDAHQVTVGVHEGTTGVTGVDHRVGLDEGLDGHLPTAATDDVDAATLGGNDAGGYRAGEAEGVAYGHHPLAHAHLVAVGELYGWQALLLDLDEGDVGGGVHTHDGGVVGTLVVEHYLEVLGVFHHVVVGGDVAVGADDDAGAATLLQGRRATRAAITFGQAEKIAEYVGNLPAATPAGRCGLGGFDVHHGGQGLFGGHGEALGGGGVDVDCRGVLGEVGIVGGGCAGHFHVLGILEEVQVLGTADGGQATEDGGEDDEEEIFHFDDVS